MNIVRYDINCDVNNSIFITNPFTHLTFVNNSLLSVDVYKGKTKILTLLPQTETTLLDVLEGYIYNDVALTFIPSGSGVTLTVYNYGKKILKAKYYDK